MLLLFLLSLIRLHPSRIADAEENLGESEVREAHLAKSLFYIRIGDKVTLMLICFVVLIFPVLAMLSEFHPH